MTQPHNLNKHSQTLYTDQESLSLQVKTTSLSGGGSLFDETLVIWVKELGDSRLHVCEDVPFVIAGSAAGRFTTGRYIHAGGRSHSHLLVSLCQAFGMELDTFGDASTGSGPLTELIG